MKNFGANVMFSLSLALIGAGCWMIYHPLGYIAVGALIWVDIQLSAFMIAQEIRELVKKDVS